MFKEILLLFFSLFLIIPAHAQEISSSTIDVVTSTVDVSTSSTTVDSFTTSTIYGVKTDRELIEQPNIRVGLEKNNQIVRFVSDSYYEIYSGTAFVGSIQSNEEVELSHKNGKYFLKSESLDLDSEIFWRLQPADSEGIFNLTGCKRSYTGRKQFYCAYRGTLEYRYSPKSKMPYLINELPLEQYMKGIAETDNNSAEGYIKALLVAARSYAYKNISDLPPTEKRLFDVYASTQDQLYLGYTSEKNMPRVAKFVEETVGEMVTYKSNPVTTPYSSRTNGKTKTWKNSKGVNDRPWLVSVECKYDKGKKQWGHGYGMSTQDALKRATKDKWDYVQLLKHYYTNTEVEKIY